jgi:SAM-dependent methyltransferase
MADDEYDDSMLAMLELIWGEGFLSPGGAESVRAIVGDVSLRDRLVLDIGCGIGGVDLVLAREYGAQVIGLDVERPVVERARALVARAGLADRIALLCIDPGPLPQPDASGDVVFGKDSWIHVEDKVLFFAEVFRVLKPGGRLLAGDWMKGPGPLSADMLYWFETEGLTYHMETQDRYAEILREAGFEDVGMLDIADDYRALAQDEYASTRGALKPAMIEALGRDGQARFEETWRAMTVVLDKGELRPGRFWARKPRARHHPTTPRRRSRR